METAKNHICKVLGEVTGEEIKSHDIESSPVADYGSSIAFKLAKKRKSSPKDIANDIAKRIKPTSLVERVEATGGYVNFYIDYRKLMEEMLKKPEFGKKQEKIVLEHTSVNPSGPIHVGRLRNTIIGDSLRRILVFYGYDVETHYYVNDVGKQIAIIAEGFDEGVKPDEASQREYDEYSEKSDFQVFFEYVSSNKKFEEDREFSSRVQERIRNAERGDKKAMQSMSSVARKCLEGQSEIFDKLGVKFDSYDYESDLLKNDSIKEVLDKLKKNSLWMSSDVGSGLDLRQFGLERKTGFTVLVRSDGTTVYLSRDLAYHLKKADAGDRLINVLGEDHKMQFKELKVILEKMLDFKKKLEVVHFSFVNFEGTKLSTRRGQIAPVDELIDEAVEKAEYEVKKREIATIDVAQMIGIGAIKFHLIRTSPTKPITFRWEEALSFEGETGPYVQYAHARSCRILEKAGVNAEDIKPESISFELENDEEKMLVRTLTEFSEAVENAVRVLRPDIVANYLIRLTSAYGGFYMKCPVLESSDGVRNRRLMLVDRTRSTIKTGLELLGIGAPERM